MKAVPCVCGRSIPFGKACPECGSGFGAVKGFLHGAVKASLGMSTYWWATLWSLALDFETRGDSKKDVAFLARRFELINRDMLRVMAPGSKTMELAKLQASFLPEWQEVDPCY